MEPSLDRHNFLPSQEQSLSRELFSFFDRDSSTGHSWHSGCYGPLGHFFPERNSDRICSIEPLPSMTQGEHRMSQLPGATCARLPHQVCRGNAKVDVIQGDCVVWIRSKILFVVLVLALTNVAWADTVTGVVVNSLGQPIPGATVEVYREGSSVVTNAVGGFTLNLVSGTYSFQIIPPAGMLLAPGIVAGFVVNGPSSMGNVTLEAGVLLSGIVRDTGNAPIVNGDLDVFDDLTGIKFNTPGDKTTVTGSFSLRVPARLLRLRAEPAAGQILVAQIQTLNVTASMSVGTIVLPQGFILSGTVRDSVTSAVLSGVDIDVDDLSTGVRIQTPGDNTNAAGVFSVIVPAGFYTVSFERSAGQLYVGYQEIVFVNNAPTNMGFVAMEAGISISGTLVDGNGFPVANADLDVRSDAGDAIVYTPGDATEYDGTFEVVVPAGNYRVVFQPTLASSLLAKTTTVQSFAASTNLGNVTVQLGQLLSGRITAFASVAPQVRCAVLLNDSVSGLPIETGDNLTDANGDYAIIVPTGTFDITLKTRKGSLARDRVYPSVVVAGPTTFNGSLQLLPMFVYVDDPAFPEPQVVLAGSPQLFITVAIYNPNGITTGTFLEAEVEGPFGTITTLLTGSPTVLAAGQVIFAQFLAVPLPPFPASLSGLPHKFRIRLRDPMDNSEVDVDEFVYFPQ